MIYLDNATATPLSDKALKEMIPFLTEKYATPFSYYPFGQSLVPSINFALEKVRALIGADEKDQILLSPSVSISTNAIFNSVWQEIAKEYGKNHFLSTQIEEAAKLFCMGKIEEMGGISTLLKVNRCGTVEPKTVAEELTPRSALLSISLANPILGTIQPMEEIGKICQERGVILHVDLNAAVGKVDIHLKEIQADIATFSCESIFGPKSCSAIWVRHGVRLIPFILGSDPEMIGAFDPALAIAFGAASEEAYQKKQERMLEVARIRSLFEQEIAQQIPEAMILFQSADRLACTSVVLFPYVVSETMAYAVAQKELYACIGGGTRQEIGHLLQACGVDPNLAKCGLSFTFTHRNSEEEILQAVKILRSEFQKYRPLSEGIFA